MGLVKEPTGVDLVIESDPLTAEQSELLSKYIADYKAKQNKKQARKKTLKSKPKVK